MDLAVSRAQYDAVRGARHLPDVLAKVLDGATRSGDGYLLHMTYEEATALNELCSWNVHTDAAGEAHGRQLTTGPGSDRQPRWPPDGRTLSFVSTRESGAQLWVLPLAGGEARRVTSLPDGVSDPLWLPDGSGLLVTSDIKWPAEQELDQRNGEFPTDARLWTNLMWRHWDDWRAGKR